MVSVARWSTAFQISNFSGGNRPVVSAVRGADAGEFVVLWDQFGDPLGLGDASGYGIYGQLYNQDGSKQGSAFLVNSSTGSDQLEPVVTPRNDGEGFIVAWRDFSRLGSGGGTDARLRFYNGAGGTSTGELIGTNGGPTQNDSQSQVSLARGEMFGAAFVTWTDTAGSPNGDGSDIRGALFSTAGGLAADFRITTAATLPGETGIQAQSNVASLPRLGFVVTWADNVGAGSAVSGGGSKIRGQLFSFLGAPIGLQFDVATTTGGSNSNEFVQYPQSAGFNQATGNQFVTAWVQDDDASAAVDFNVHARVFGISGNAAVGGSSFILSQTTTANQSQVVITSYGTDRFIAVWTHGAAFSAPDVRARMFKSDGTALTDEFIVIPEDTLAANFAGQLGSVTVLDDTINAHPIPRFVVTWNDNTGNMWGQIFSPAASELLGIDWFGSERGETYTAQYNEHVLAGNGGGDNLTGSATADQISGGAGNDTLAGAAGGDTLKGEVGKDSLSGGAGNDTLEGGFGNDILAGGSDSNALVGGGGWDKATYAIGSGSATITRNTNGTVTISGAGFSDTLSGVEIASFTNRDVALKERAASDLDGNGGSDIVLQSGGTVVGWLVGGGVAQSGNVIGAGVSGWNVVGTGDFNGDGTMDTLLQNGGTVVQWTIQGGLNSGGTLVGAGVAGWNVVGTGDFDADGTTDVVLQNGGTVVQWRMQNGVAVSGTVIGAGVPGWNVVGTGDFNGDGSSDVLLQNGGTVVAWNIKNGANIGGTVLGAGVPGWSVVGTGDFNGDGTTDVVLQNGATVVDWIVQNNVAVSGNVIGAGVAGWNVVATGDYNGDGTTDIALQNGGTVVNWTVQNGLVTAGNVLGGAGAFTVIV